MSITAKKVAEVMALPEEGRVDARSEEEMIKDIRAKLHARRQTSTKD
jgi:hypothetical protein